MNLSTLPAIEQGGLREIIAFPKVDEFYDLLQDRLHMVAGSYILQYDFTLIVNALERRKTEFQHRYANVPLIYAGIPRQRELLEGEPIHWRQELDEHWDLLDSSNLDSDTAVVSSQLYQSFNNGTYGLADIPRVGSGKLEDYFASILYPNQSQRNPTPRQVAEYHILKNYFNLMEDRYLSVPLVQFGEFDGIIHIVYTDADRKNITPRSIGNLIRSFSTIMEALVLEWDLVGRNPEKTKAIMVPLNPVFYEQVNRNPILRELKFDVYYQKHLPFFKSRIRFNDEVIHSKVYRPYLKTAIISIMIDSYAHNVSAHSLVALNWWFKRRADALRDHRERHRQEVEESTEIIREYLPEGFEQDRLFDLIKPWMNGSYMGEVDEDYDVVKYPGSLAREIQPLIKFLMQKGAFWSGIARDNHFGGESSALFDVFWSDFINNPLYLGTIAKSEDIHRISLHFVHYAPQVTYPGATHHLVQKKVLQEGELVRINLKEKRPAEGRDEQAGYYLSNQQGDRYYYRDYPELAGMSEFVAPGLNFAAMKTLLNQFRIFLPGEVVGRHAFFTLMENEIRNVKHYKGEALRRIQQEGLRLYISIQEKEVVPHSGQYPIYQLGIWIGAPADLVLPDGSILVERKYDGLHKDIMDEETFAPRLGGGFQDKICAGMLFNNRFGNVQRGDGNVSRDLSEDNPRDDAFYPWIIPATSELDSPHLDIEVSREIATDWWTFRDQYPHQRGYFKKYFHLWKAADIKEVTEVSDAHFVWENLARFKFVSVVAPPTLATVLYHKIRAAGVIRIIYRQDAIGTGPAAILQAYQYWLPTWLGDTSYCVQLRVDGALTGQFTYLPDRQPVFRYQHMDELTRSESTDLDDYQLVKQIHLAHGGMSLNPNYLRYRNHGIYKKYFLGALEPGQALNVRASARMAELFEVLTTRISIFDNRIYSRIRGDERLSVFEDTLELKIFPESFSTLPDGSWDGYWEKEKHNTVSHTHFLILHLSFIEKMLLAKYSSHPQFEEENVGLFIEQEILPLISVNGQVRENFMLVITTGRGRTKWWSKLADDVQYEAFTRFTMFRPVESLISVIEDAITRKDDLELKYNLVKILFGA